MQRRVRELKTGHDALYLNYHCSNCDGREMFVELHPMKRKRHAKRAHRLELRVRCVRCKDEAVLHRGSVSHRRRFRVLRFPRKHAA